MIWCQDFSCLISDDVNKEAKFCGVSKIKVYLADNEFIVYGSDKVRVCTINFQESGKLVLK